MLKGLEQLRLDRERWDRELRGFAADNMTDSANGWLDDKNHEAEVKEPPITVEDFSRRITLDSIDMMSSTGFTAYFDDDGLFWGHTITVDTDLETGCTDTDIMG